MRAQMIADDFEASIRILRFDEGGRKSPPFNGIRWDFNYANEQPSVGLYMIWPDFIDAAGNSVASDSPLPIDTALNARMTVLIDEMRAQVHRSRIAVGTKFYCCEGPKRVAEGHVTRITGLLLDR
jgi:translation elongation factor EF-Tu-like GTPase